jgi:Tfp pilus assembly protein PilX
VNGHRSRCGALLANSRGAALVLALMILVGLSAITLALLSIARLEPLISRNHVDVVRARYLAEAGIEHAFDVLARNAGAWSQYLIGATCTTGALLADATVPHGGADGHFTVRLRNDCAPGDDRVTGKPLDGAGDATHDANGIVLAVSLGIVGRTTHTVTAVISDDHPTRERGQSVPRGELKTYNWADR